MSAGVARTDLGSFRWDGERPPTGDDRAEVHSFQRFLRIAPRPGDETGWIRRRAIGWLPYVLGLGPAPPEGLDDVAPSAWTFPA